MIIKKPLSLADMPPDPTPEQVNPYPDFSGYFFGIVAAVMTAFGVAANNPTTDPANPPVAASIAVARPVSVIAKPYYLLLTKADGTLELRTGGNLTWRI
jgi:hypothetical protein